LNFNHYILCLDKQHHGRKKENKQRQSSQQQQQHKSCRKQKFRDFYIEANGCRSKRPYNMAKCISDNANTSCVAKKSDMRTIRFVCPDGKAYRKEVEIIRRCGKAKASAAASSWN
jgi:hypothetical protein